jgi:hypothetical protein
MLSSSSNETNSPSSSVSVQLPGLRASLLNLGVAHLRLHYDGQGGKGVIGETVPIDGNGRHSDLALAIEAWQSFRKLCLTLLESRFPLWYMDDGALGEFSWDVRTDELIHRHEICVIEFRSQELRGLSREQAQGSTGATKVAGEIPF